MAVYPVSTRKLLIDQYDISGHLNSLTFNLNKDANENTVFGNTAHSTLPGIKGFTLEHSGFGESGTGLIETITSDNWNSTAKIMSVLSSNVSGEPAYSAQGIVPNYTLGGKIGDMYGFNGSAVGAGGITIVRGALLATGSKATGGNGTAYQLGAVSTAQYVYGIIHCTAHNAGSTTITVKIQSSSAENFSVANDRITFSVLADVGKQWATPVAGEITDTWWRATWAVTSTPAATIYVIAGIL